MRGKLTRIISDSYYIGYKDLLELVRDRMMVVSFILMPIFMMIMTGYVFPSENVLRDIPVGMVNEDDGEWGFRLEGQLKEIKLGEKQRTPFRLVSVPSKAEAKKQIQRQVIHGAIIIPADFSTGIAAGEQRTITLVVDQSNPQLSATLSQMLEGMIGAFSRQLGAEQVRNLSPGAVNAEAIVQPFTMQSEGAVSGKTNYFEFMAPGVMAMVVIMAVITGLASAIAREKETGTLDGILVAPVSRLSIILGKTFSQAARGLLQGGLVLLLAMLIFKVVLHGSILLVILLLLLAVFSFVGLGVLVSAIASRQEAALTILMTLYFPMLFLSGAFFPVQQMPPWMQGVSQLLPLTYAVQALRKVIILGAGLPAVTLEVLVLTSFGLVTLLIAIPAFNRVVTR